MADKTVPVLPPINSPSDTSQPGGARAPVPGSIEQLIGPSSKDTMIGVGTLLVLAIVFFFIRMAFVNYLVGPSMKRSPNNAGLAGWWLFGGLFFLATLGCYFMVLRTYLLSPREAITFYSMPVVVVLSTLSLICFVLTFVAASKK